MDTVTLEGWMELVSLLGDDDLDVLLGWMEGVCCSGALPEG